MKLIYQVVLLLVTITVTPCFFSSESNKEHSDHDELSSNNEVSHNEIKIIKLSDDVIKDNNIKVLVAKEKNIKISRDVLGKIVPNANKTIYIYPRYSGIIKSLTKYLGDKVQKDDVLATIESDTTLQTYTIKAPFSGYIVKKNVNLGEHIKNNNSIYQLADLSDVWVDLFIYRKNAKLIKKGQKVIIYKENGGKHAYSSTISYISPLGVEHNQTMLARAVFSNNSNNSNYSDNLNWLPGLYVDGVIIISNKTVPVAIKTIAIQSLEGKNIVFIKAKDGFKPVQCKLGIQDSEFTQILEGITAGQQYVASNSFLLKAHLEKESASHSH